MDQPNKMDLVSIVIPCYNPRRTLLDAVISAKNQTHQSVEVIVVDDGTNSQEGKVALRSVARLADRYIKQPNCGVSAARNAGFRVAQGAYVVPLDCDDVLHRRYVAECLGAIAAQPEAAFVYTDYRVFGEQNYTEHPPDYNFHYLLDRNVLPYAALIRRAAWVEIGGYDERMRLGCEDWEFWLRLGAAGKWGKRLSKVLFRYRKHGHSLSDVARQHAREIREYMRTKHAELYTYESRARIKAAWEPAVCVVGAGAPPDLLDCEITDLAVPSEILHKSRAKAFAISSGSAAQSCAAELAALAVWAGNRCVRLPDGSLAVSREALQRRRRLEELSSDAQLSRLRSIPRSPRYLPRAMETLRRHLHNAGVLSAKAWLTSPRQSALRLIPLRIKEEINRRLGHPIFDLSFYLQFQPTSVILDRSLVVPLSYLPRLDSGRRRVALVTPHLGAGGAETVLLDIARALDRTRFEIFLIATQASDVSRREQWSRTVDHVYDLAALAPAERVPGSLYSIVRNWRFETLLIQNALQAYSVIPELKANLPEIRIMDLIHSVDEHWDLLSSTAEIARLIDTRIVISEAARARALQLGTPESRIRLIRNGIDLARFTTSSRRAGSKGRILFAARLDPVKRPLLLVDIVAALKRRRGKADFRVIVAGEGPEEAQLHDCARRAGVMESFDFLGHMGGMASLFADADLLILTSRSEGIPMVVLEAFAAGRPVVVSDAGAVGEVVDSTTGFLIQHGPGEVEAFAQAIDTLLDAPELRDRMGVEGRRRVEAEWNLEAFRHAYRDLFDAPPVFDRSVEQ